eukprot:gnl/MRDRNA2_/MRDRNA2_97338_c0_seq1.p1 gnl/MRDRNA2_/MRDRNA2_97338_c0~~gnl/MRDRNA2_/MRDRNA2_97338_c0_seq1.p1  ORF type:complete len:543 (+),score=158.40 gnl/MRDRNA2_/MRDRNA2_97338_c0_seq1:100-1728(+)
MPTHFGPEPPADSDDSDDDDSDNDKKFKITYDEYGEQFEDYGFLTRAQQKKEAGNRHFQRERYAEAMKQYQEALNDCVTLNADPSIKLSKKKWIDIVIFRATIHMNKSTCWFKQRDYRQSCACAVECIVGNIREQSMFADYHIRQKLKKGERKEGTMGSQILVEQRLPRWLRAKAWFRMSQCYCNLEYCDRAKEALAKSLEMAEGPMIDQIQVHMAKIEAVEKACDRRQRKQFSGFFNKLQDRGGYMEDEEDDEKKGPEWDRLNYEQKFKKIQELDDSDDEGDSRISSGVNTPKKPSPMAMMSEADRERATRLLRAKLTNLKVQELGINDEMSFEEKRSRMMNGIDIGKVMEETANEMGREKSYEMDQSFEAYQKKKASGGYAQELEPTKPDPLGGFDEDTLRAAGLDPEVLKENPAVLKDLQEEMMKAVPPLKSQAAEEKPVERPKAAFKLPFAKKMLHDPRSLQPPPKAPAPPPADTAMLDKQLKREALMRESQQAHARSVQEAKEKHEEAIIAAKQKHEQDTANWKSRVEELDDSDEDP